jgi:Rad3-related DNA helicase/DNA polymerase III epsilon subunit-like protein
VSAATSAPEAFVAFDLETTGLSPKADRILEIGAVRYDRDLRRVDDLQLIVDPGIPIPLPVQRLVGLGPGDVRGAPTPVEGVAELADFCDGAALVVHGGVFDIHFCAVLAPDAFANRLTFDTLDLARILLPAAEAHGLPQLSARLGLPHDRPHRALSDAEAAGALFAYLVDAARSLPAETLAAMRRVAGQSDGPVTVFLEALASARALPPRGFARSEVVGVERVASGRGPRDDRTRSEPSRTAPRATGESASNDFAARVATMRLEDATAAAFAVGGPLDAGDGFEYRDEQVQMARAVAQALERGRRLVVEAGTGVGKSLAYLVPLVLWAERRKSRAVVATHTVNLQEQLADRDLPRLAALTRAPVPAALLKGRSHYISLRRWERFLARPDVHGQSVDADAIRFKLKVLVWLTQTATGDRSELRLTAEEETLWRRVASDREDCLGSACANWGSRRCHMVAARVRAADAAIIVTNHALLLAGAERQGQVFPSYAALIVDEAHHLEAAATEQLGASLRGFDLALVLDRLPGRPGSALAQAVDRSREAGQRLFGDAKGLLIEALGGDGAHNGRVGLSASLRDEGKFAVLLKAARHAIGVLLDTSTLLESSAAEDSVQDDLLPQPGAAGDEMLLGAAALRGIAATIDHVICRPRAGFVAWLELRAEQSELHEAPISVAEPLRELVYDQCDSVTLTSATMAVGDSFAFIRDRVGIGDGAEELAVASPFDFLRQALCVLPDSVPPYDDAAHDHVIAEMVGGIAESLDGHTLVLFTGYGPLRRVHALLRERLERHGISLVGQGLDGTRRQILRSFLEDPRTVLLGTNSFWEGIDIPGERLRCVVIDKLPFAVPTDPLIRARTEGLRDPFLQYVLPMAVIRLRQGFGRLIRGRGDRGAVVLCDERLSRRDYGDVFLRALPPAAEQRAPVDDVPELVARFALAEQSRPSPRLHGTIGS